MTDDQEEGAPTPAERLRHARTYRIVDLVVAGFFILLGLVALEQVATELPLMHLRQVGPGMLPFGVGVIMVAMGVIVVVQNLTGSTVIPDIAMPTLSEGSRVFAVVALFVVTILLIPVVGTLATLGLFILAETKLVERRSWAVSLATAIFVPLFIYAAFEALLGVPLPVGVLGLR